MSALIFLMSTFYGSDFSSGRPFICLCWLLYKDSLCLAIHFNWIILLGNLLRVNTMPFWMISSKDTWKCVKCLCFQHVHSILSFRMTVMLHSQFSFFSWKKGDQLTTVAMESHPVEFSLLLSLRFGYVCMWGFMPGFRGLQCFLTRLFLVPSVSSRLRSSSQQLFGIPSHAELESLHLLRVISAPVLCSDPWRGRTEMLQLRRSFREIGPPGLVCQCVCTPANVLTWGLAAKAPWWSVLVRDTDRSVCLNLS